MYFVIYDLNDNIIAYLETEADVLNFTGMRKDNFRKRIEKGYCYYQYNDTYRKIYKFEE